MWCIARPGGRYGDGGGGGGEWGVGVGVGMEVGVGASVGVGVGVGVGWWWNQADYGGGGIFGLGDWSLNVWRHLQSNDITKHPVTRSNILG